MRLSWNEVLLGPLPNTLLKVCFFTPINFQNTVSGMWGRAVWYKFRFTDVSKELTGSTFGAEG
jgi:hypothetical protein